MKRVVISCGPISAKLDSVKFITNRFKGGLAFKTAEALIDSEKYDVTIVKWEHTELPHKFHKNGATTGLDYWCDENVHIINVNDVAEYYNWFKDNASNYDAFIMAAAVANLMPSEPYEGKFPSHNYKVGEQFDIKFEIAPRAIDIIKKLNTRCCLIGYKLFDAITDEELIEIASHTLNDSKANIIFANTPSTAKERKIALMQDGSAIPMTFDTHIEYIHRAINAEYFTTTLKSIGILEESNSVIKQINEAKQFIKYFETTFDGHGSAAIKVGSYGMVTTSRGHASPPVYIKGIDFESREILADGKATLNAPLLWKMLENNDCDYVVHRHFDDSRAELKTKQGWDVKEYVFPGTTEELKLAEKINYKSFLIGNHGYVLTYKFKDVDWNKYYDQFPERYFGTPTMMQSVVKSILSDSTKETLEIGSNIHCMCKYSLDKNVNAPNGIPNLTYGDLKTHKFDLILLRNSINYLTPDEIDLAVQALNPHGVFIANSFRQAPSIKITSNELAISDGKIVKHYLFIKDQAYKHSFYARGKAEYIEMGFEVISYSDKAILILKRNEE